jgi:hypothetical protein
MMWALNGHPWEYDGEAVDPKSVNASWVRMASPDRILALLDRLAALEAALSVERIAAALPEYTVPLPGTGDPRRYKTKAEFAAALRAALLAPVPES